MNGTAKVILYTSFYTKKRHVVSVFASVASQVSLRPKC